MNILNDHAQLLLETLTAVAERLALTEGSEVAVLRGGTHPELEGVR